MRWAVLLLAALPAAAWADDPTGLRARIEALQDPAPLEDVQTADRARLAAAADRLFADGAAIALFVGPDCAACPQAVADLRATADAAGRRYRVIDTSTAPNAALFRALRLDTLPSYAMPDRLFRGAMPTVVLRRYLAD